MPHGQLEYGVLYHIEQGPSRERIFDAARLGGMDSPIGRINFEFRGNYRDYIGPAIALVDGVHRLPNNMLFIWGKLPKQPEGLHGSMKLDEIWNRAFYFTQYNLNTHKGRIVLSQRSLLENPIKHFGDYQEAEDEL